MPEGILKLAEAAKRVKYSVATLRAAIRRGELKAAQAAPGGPYRVRREALLEWLRKLEERRR